MIAASGLQFVRLLAVFISACYCCGIHPVQRKHELCISAQSQHIKVVPYSITSVGLHPDPGFLAVSPRMT